MLAQKCTNVWLGALPISFIAGYGQKSFFKSGGGIERDLASTTCPILYESFANGNLDIYDSIFLLIEKKHLIISCKIAY